MPLAYVCWYGVVDKVLFFNFQFPVNTLILAMPLFQQSVIRKYIADVPKPLLEAAWVVFQTHFYNAAIQQNIRSAKEEQYQEGFLRELFVAVLGYTLNPQPDFNLTTEYKNERDSRF